LRHTALSIWNLVPNHEFTIHSHVVDRVQLVEISKRSLKRFHVTHLHAVWIELSRSGDASKLLHLQQAFS
jgi:hypothetical protein